MGDIMKNIAVFLLFLAIISPLGAQAETVLRIGDNVAVEANQVVNGDYYVSVGPFGNTNMSGSIEGDMYAFGGSVTANGAVSGDLTVIGGTSQLHATVTDDVRIIAGETTIADHVGGDLFVIAGKLTVLSTAHIEGDVIFFGGEGEINGTISGSILGTSEHIDINGVVGENVDVKAGQATIGSNARIKGFVDYESPKTLNRAQDAVIEGKVAHTEVELKTQGDGIKQMLVPSFIALFAALSLFLLFKKELQILAQEVHMHPLRSISVGFGVLILGPVISILLIATVLGLLIGIAGIAVSAFFYALAYAMSGIVLGTYIAKLFSKKINVSFTWIIIGTFALHALYFIPFVGLPVLILVFAITLGGVAHHFYKHLS
jgi:hypothetical protein